MTTQDREFQKEEWLPVVGFEGIYDVSDHGRVKRVKLSRRSKPGHILKGSMTVSGYPQVGLSVNGKRTSYKTHRLVAMAFIPFAQDDLEVNHKDCNKTNNNVDNLEWVSRSENMKHAANIFGVNCGERCVKSKLTEKKVIEIRQLYNTGEYSYRRLAKIYGLGSKSTIEGVVTKKTWYHI